MVTTNPAILARRFGIRCVRSTAAGGVRDSSAMYCVVTCAPYQATLTSRECMHLGRASADFASSLATRVWHSGHHQVIPAALSRNQPAVYAETRPDCLFPAMSEFAR